MPNRDVMKRQPREYYLLLLSFLIGIVLFAVVLGLQDQYLQFDMPLLKNLIDLTIELLALAIRVLSRFSKPG